jgi:hypothetical protein
METTLVEVHRPTAESAIDVIFIHGLDGDPDATWRGDGDDAFWPRWLGDDLGSAAVWSVGYNAWSSKWRGSSMPLPERAINLLTYLESIGIGERPICFICHSLGGLVAKQILLHGYLNPDDPNRVARAIRGIVFLGTPHTGAALANAANTLRTIYRPTRATRDLEDNLPYLKQLNDWYRGLVTKGGLSHLIMYKT